MAHKTTHDAAVHNAFDRRHARLIFVFITVMVRHKTPLYYAIFTDNAIMGNRYIVLCAALLFFLGVAVTVESQEGEEAEGQPNRMPVFPIHRLWKDAEKNTTRWQPDWPLDIPPDSFDPVSSGKARGVSIMVENPGTDITENSASAGETAESSVSAASPEPRVPAVYTARLDADGRLVEFPFLRDGVFYQASAQYGRDDTDGQDDERVIKAMTLALSPDESAEIAVLATDEGRPVTARIKAGETYYFASFLWQADTCVEMWTDEAGVPLAVLRDERIFHYDSMQNITFISSADSGNSADSSNATDDGAGGIREVSARYNDKGPRYWTRDGTTLSFQRDETGLLVSLEDIQRNKDDTPPVNSRYEYAFDQNGNWTERREIRWTTLNGYLVPSEGAVITRLIEY
jgi:hypothetical protein